MSVAYHEAGHAVMRVRLGRPLVEVSLGAPVPHNTQVLGCVDTGLTAADVDQQRGDWRVDLGEVLVALAGPVAQQIFDGRWDELHAYCDVEAARAVVEQAAGTLHNDSSIVKAIVAGAQEQCEEMFLHEGQGLLWKKVVAVAEALNVRGRLTRVEVERLMTSVSRYTDDSPNPL